MAVNGTQALYVEQSNKDAEAVEVEVEKKPDSLVRVSAETHEVLKEVAEAEDRTVKAVTERAIRQSLTKGQNRASKYHKMNSKGELV